MFVFCLLFFEGFAEHIDYAIEQKISFSDFVFDHWYFSEKTVRHIESKQRTFVSELASNTRVMYSDKWVGANELAKLIPSTDFERVTLPNRHGQDREFFTYSYTTGNLGCLSFGICRLFTLLCLCWLFLWKFLGRSQLLSRRTFASGFALVMLTAGVLLLTEDSMVALCVFPLLLTGIDILLRSWEVNLERLDVVGVASVLYVLAFAGYLTVTFFREVVVTFSREMSMLISSLVASETVTLGPSISGFWIWMSIQCYIIGFAIYERRIRLPLLSTFLLLASYLSFVVMLGKSWFIEQSAPAMAAAQVRLLLMGSIALIPLSICGFSRATSPKISKTSQPRILVGAFAFLLAAVSMFALFHTLDFISERNNRILVYNKGYLDWDVPEFGKYGPFQGGMFGLMPKYLALEDYEISRLDDEVITADAIRKHGVLVLINVGKKWKREELEAIWNFVEEGGSLLVLGDHTNVFGLQECYDELLAPVNISFEFDSAYPCREGWVNCIQLHPSPIVAGLRGYRGEPIGDMVLVAGAYYGKGKILVFGDTSSFQNGAWYSCFQPFTHNVFKWLCSKSCVGNAWFLRPSLLVLLVLACILG